MIPSYAPDLFSDEVLTEPYEHYRGLRDLGPVVWLEAQQMYLLPRFEDVRAAEKDPATFCSGQGVGLNDLINSAGAGTTLMSDGERHDTQRKLLFGPLRTCGRPRRTRPPSAPGKASDSTTSSTRPARAPR